MDISKPQSRSLARAIRRKLFVRLSLAAVVISLILATIAYFGERRFLGLAVIDRARVATGRLNAQIMDVLDSEPIDRAALQTGVDAYRYTRVEQRMGSFVVARIYDRAGEELAGITDDAHPQVAEVGALMDRARRVRAGDYGNFQMRRVGGVPHIRVAVPLENSRGDVVAHIEGVFAVSAEYVADVDRRILRTIVATFAVVFVTTVLVYPIINGLLGRVTGLAANLLDSNLETLKVLGCAVAKRDSDTDIHNYRVTLVSVRIAEAAGLDARTIQSLIKGAFVHDVGKIGIGDKILLKPGKLTDDEYAVMKQHVDHGVDIVSRSDWLTDAANVVGHHHEKFDGSGYRDGLSGESIPVTARIFAIADVFDALTSKRPYKEPMSFDQAMEILEAGRGTHFDPDFLDVFSSIARRVYDDLANRDDEGPRQDLDGLIKRYFSADIPV